MDAPDLYWSAMETMDRERLDALQLLRVRALVRYLEEQSPFYRQKFSALGITSDCVRSIADLSLLPFTSKQDIVNASQGLAGPHGDLFCGDPGSVARWHKTSGTTGKGVRIADTIEDWDGYAECSAEALCGMGVRRSDVVVVAFGYGPFIAFWGYIAGLEKIGAAFIPAGSLDTIGRIELIKEFNATVFMSTPSYSIHAGETAASQGVDLAGESKVRLIILTGEPSTPLTKKRVRDLWGARPADRFGSTETGGIAFECPVSPNTYHIQEGFVIPEFVDPANDRAVEPGGVAELIVTPLYRRGMPLLRFRTGNLVKTSVEERCKCGRTYRSLEETENGVVIRRLDKLLKIKGVLVDPVAIENIVRASDIFGEEYRIIFEKKGGMDAIRVRMEIRKGLEPQAMEEKRKALAHELRRKMLLSIDLEFVPFGLLERFEEKGKRIIDSR